MSFRKDVKTRIAIKKEYFNKNMILSCVPLEIELRKKTMNCYTWGVLIITLLHRVELRTLSKEHIRRLEAMTRRKEGVI